MSDLPESQLILGARISFQVRGRVAGANDDLSLSYNVRVWGHSQIAAPISSNTRIRPGVRTALLHWRQWL